MNTQRDVPGADADPAAADPGTACADAAASVQAAGAAERVGETAEVAVDAGAADADAGAAARGSEPAPHVDAAAAPAMGDAALAPVGSDAPRADEAAAVADARPVEDEVAATRADAVPASVPTPATPGMRLRERREERGIGLQQVTDSLHIEPRLVAAMEADDFAVFDAPVYARGFLRKYAAFLELPSDEIVAGYDALHRGPEAPSLIPTASAAEPPRDWSALRLPAVAAVALAVVAGSYWWWTLRPPTSTLAERASPTAVVQSAAPTPPPGTGVDAAPSASAAPAVSDGAAPAQLVAATDSAAAGATGASQSAVVAPSASTVPGVAPAPPPRVVGRGVLEFRFTADCWIEVYGPAGERLLFDLARAGESRAVSGPGPWRVFVGYADGVRMSVGGRGVAIPAGRRSGATARFVVAADGAAQ